MIMGSMRNWLHGGELDGVKAEDITTSPVEEHPTGLKKLASDVIHGDGRKKKKNRVVVVHCKAGKGRSGTISCSYLISEEGWKPEDALARFTERRMRPRFGAGVSIPSQLRWITYVERWTKGNKKYSDRPIEIVEIHVWGLRNGVKVDVEGFAEEGKRIEVLHTFKKDERLVIQGDAPEGGGVSDMLWGMAGYGTDNAKAKNPEELESTDKASQEDGKTEDKDKPKRKMSTKVKRKGTELLHKVSPASSAPQVNNIKAKTIAGSTASPSQTDVGAPEASQDAEPGGMAVILKPKQPIQVANSDVNIAVERRNKTPKSMGLTMVTAVGHVWFNAFFEGGGPEQDGKPDENGVFSIEWDAMDGIKGSSRKGARAMDRISVVWRFTDGASTEEVKEPEIGEPIPKIQPANWEGARHSERDLGLRVQSPVSADVSKASSIQSVEESGVSKVQKNEDNGDMEGVKTSGPEGEELGKKRHGKGKEMEEEEEPQRDGGLSGEVKESKTL